MKISIITIVRNNKDTIKDAIESVLGQTYKNIEYIVVDGASSDGTAEVIRNYGNKITTFVSESDNGIYDGLNKGVSLATGGVVAFLHSDDLYASDNIVQIIADEFNQDDSLDGVYGDLIYTPKDDTLKVLRYWKSREFSQDLLAKGWMPAHPTLFLRREVYQKYGSFDTGFKIAGDYDFMLRILKDNIVVKYLPQVICKMRAGGESNRSIKNMFNKSKEDLRAMRKNKINKPFLVLFYKNITKVMQLVRR